MEWVTISYGFLAIINNNTNTINNNNNNNHNNNNNKIISLKLLNIMYHKDSTAKRQIRAEFS